MGWIGNGPREASDVTLSTWSLCVRKYPAKTMESTAAALTLWSTTFFIEFKWDPERRNSIKL